MAFVNRMMASGISAGAANNISGDVSAALTAAGTNKATSLALSSAVNYLGTVGSSTGVSLPAMNQGDLVEVYNNGANAVLVYTTIGVSDVINAQSANGGFTVSAAKGASFRKCTSTVVMTNYSK